MVEVAFALEVVVARETEKKKLMLKIRLKMLHRL